MNDELILLLSKETYITSFSHHCVDLFNAAGIIFYSISIPYMGSRAASRIHNLYLCVFTLSPFMIQSFCRAIFDTKYTICISYNGTLIWKGLYQ